VDGKSGATGDIVLTLDQSAVNDNFANCEFIGGANGSATGSNVSASRKRANRNTGNQADDRYGIAGRRQTPAG